MRRQGRGPGCRSGGWGRGRGAGPGRHSGGEDKDVRARLLQNTQAGPAPRAWVVGSSSSAESCPWRTGAREEPGPAPARWAHAGRWTRPRRRLAAPRTRPPLRTLRTGNKGSERASGLPERAQRLGRGASSGGGSAPGQGLRRPCPRSGGSGQQLSPPATPPVEPLRSAQLGNGHLVCCCVRYLPEREWEEIAPLSCPETNPLKAKAARCVRGEALES